MSIERRAHAMIENEMTHTSPAPGDQGASTSATSASQPESHEPSSYAWEATDESIAERYGLPLDAIVRFDTNTAPAPPPIAHRILADGPFDVSLSEYPPSDYRRLVTAAARRYGVGEDELLVGAGADEVLDLIVKAFLPPGGAAVVPVPTYAMFEVLTEQRPARVVRVPRRPAAGFGIDVPAVRAAAASADLVWLCSPNNPTGLPEAPGVIDELLETLAADADRAGRAAPVIVIDEAYAEFAGVSNLDIRSAYPRFVVVRTMSKAYAIAGLRVGFAIARPEVIATIARYRPPGSVSVPSIAVATWLLEDEEFVAENVARTSDERSRLADGLRAAGWSVHPSATNFLLVELPSPEQAATTAEELMARGLVPRTFGPDHPLARCLRFTVRNVEQDDRLLEAVRELAR